MDPKADKRRAMYWLTVAILVAMPIVAHVYTVPFYLFFNQNVTAKAWCENNKTSRDQCYKTFCCGSKPFYSRCNLFA